MFHWQTLDIGKKINSVELKIELFCVTRITIPNTYKIELIKKLSIDADLKREICSLVLLIFNLTPEKIIWNNTDCRSRDLSIITI